MASSLTRICVCLMVTAAAGMIPSGQAVWHSETIDAPHVFQNMSPRSMAVDSQGYHHIAYGFNHLYYASETAGGWQVVTVDDSVLVGDRAVLVLDSTDAAHIAYYDRLNNRIKYAFEYGSGFYVQTLPLLEEVSNIFTMALDSDGDPWFCYLVDSGNEFKVLWDNGGGVWDSDTLALLTAPLHAVSMVMDGYSPRIAYVAGSAGDTHLSFMYASGGLWEHLSLDPDTITGSSLDMQLDSIRFVHICYTDTIETALKYLTFEPGGWPGAPQIVDASGNTGLFCSIQLKALDRPVIGYLDATADRIKYAAYNGSAWSITTIPGTSGGGRNLSMTIDPGGNPSFSHYNVGQKSLIFTSSSGSAWNHETIDTLGSAGICHSMALNSAGDPFVAYSDQYRDGVFAADHDAYGWTLQIVDAGAPPSVFVSCDRDSRGDPHIAYFSPGQPLLYYASRSAAGWVVDPVDLQGAYGGELQLKFDSMDHPHICFLDTAEHIVKHAWNTGTGWSVETAVDDMGFFVEIQLDNGDRPHLSCQGSDQALWYARKTESGWTSVRVTADNPTGNPSSLALDGSGNPHIAYYDGTAKEIRYAALVGGNWALETVADKTPLGRTLSIAVNGEGNPMVLYTDYQSQMVYFSEKTPGGWIAQTVDPGPVAANSAHIRKDPLGKPAVSYNNSLAGDLRMSWRQQEISYDLSMPDTWFEAGEYFVLYRRMTNAGTATVTVDEYLLLDVYGAYWFGPSWTQTPEYQTIPIDSGYVDTEKIFLFTWPAVTGHAAGIRFWGGVVESGTVNLLDYDMAEFGW